MKSISAQVSDLEHNYASQKNEIENLKTIIYRLVQQHGRSFSNKKIDEKQAEKLRNSTVFLAQEKVFIQEKSKKARFPI